MNEHAQQVEVMTRRARRHAAYTAMTLSGKTPEERSEIQWEIVCDLELLSRIQYEGITVHGAEIVRKSEVLADRLRAVLLVLENWKHSPVMREHRYFVRQDNPKAVKRVSAKPLPKGADYLLIEKIEGGWKWTGTAKDLGRSLWSLRGEFPDLGEHGSDVESYLKSMNLTFTGKRDSLNGEYRKAKNNPDFDPLALVEIREWLKNNTR